MADRQDPGFDPAAVSQSEGRRSRIFTQVAPGQWDGLAPETYKQEAACFKGVVRWELMGKRGEPAGFHVRYFEIEPGGFSTLECHQHIHAVCVLHGRGVARLGDQEHPVKAGDLIYIAPQETHQMRNPYAEASFGFLCIVDADRDRPQHDREHCPHCLPQSS